MAHQCHAIGCKVGVAPAMFMCKPHWFQLPKDKRDLIWRYYKAGQQDSKTPSKEYCQTAVNCIRWLAEAQGRTILGAELELRMYLQFHSPLEGVVPHAINSNAP